MAGVTHDDGFHEIQLNGKQLVFLFMAVTVVSVVIFLCGVLVGRGVRLERGGPADTVAADTGAVAPPAAEAGAGASETPVAPNENLNYPKVLGGDTPPAEKIAPAEPPPAKSEPVGEVPPSPPPSEPAPPVPAPPEKAVSPAAPAAPGEPPGPGLAVQVAAFRVRGEADALALRLIGKDYKAYVVPPSAGAPPLFRVRVGKFKEQREADQVVAKLKKEEQFEPWIVR